MLLSKGNCWWGTGLRRGVHKGKDMRVLAALFGACALDNSINGQKLWAAACLEGVWL